MTLTADLTANGPQHATGTVRFIDNGETLATVPITQNKAVFTTSTLHAGAQTISAAYSGDANYAADTSNSITQTVNGTGTLTTLTSSANPVGLGDPVTFTAKVSSSHGQGPVPTGRVVFADSGTAINSAPLTNGTATFNTSTLSQGVHQITAAYSGDGVYAASTSAALPETVGVASTTTTLVPVKNPIVYGQDPVAFIVTVSAQGVSKPAGTVSLKEGANTLTSGPLDPNGQANLAYPQGLNAGSHSLTAAYAGSAGFGASVSGQVPLTVDQAQTATSLTVSPTDPTTYGQILTLTAKVTAPGDKQTGTVTFFDGNRTLGTANVAAGSALFSTGTLTGGSHALSALYGGDINYAASRSAVVDRNVTPAAPTVSLASSVNPAAFGQTVVLTIAVSSPGGVPTGKVSLLNSGAPLALLDLSSGGASYNLQNFKPGTYDLSASYHGDGNFAAANSNPLAQVINHLTPTIALTSSQNPSKLKATVTFTASITGVPSLPPSGTLIFYDASTAIGTTQISAGKGAYSTSALSVGNHPITATWAGDDNYQAATSNAVNQVVDPATSATTTTLTSSKNPSTAGDTVTFRAQVQSVPVGMTPTGTITLMDGVNFLARFRWPGESPA